MRYIGEYENKVQIFFIKQEKQINRVARYIKKIYYSIPLEIEDLVSFAFFKLIESENKIHYFKIKHNQDEVIKFFNNKLYSYMWSYCNSYVTKNHQILNNNVNFDEIENSSLIQNENYKYEELFSFLTSDEFTVIYEIYVNKLKRKQIASKLNISKSKVKLIENNARNKICKHYNVIL